MRDHSILSYYAESNYLDIIAQQLTFLFRIMWIVLLTFDLKAGETFDLEAGERILQVTF